MKLVSLREKPEMLEVFISYFQKNCDYVLENDGTESQFQEKCLAFFQELDIMNHN